MELSDFQKDILGYCTSDDTYFSLILRSVSEKDYHNRSLPKWAREKALTVIRDLMNEGLIEAGNINGLDFRSFSLSVDETITYIEQELDKLGHWPRPGDICWFRGTAKGERIAQELGLGE